MNAIQNTLVFKMTLIIYKIFKIYRLNDSKQRLKLGKLYQWVYVSLKNFIKKYVNSQSNYAKDSANIHTPITK